MTKRNTKPESLSTGAAARPKRAGANHSRKSSASSTTFAEPISVDTDAVARLAYSYWEARGCAGGSPEEDWLRAEHELLSR